jgi:lipopolysaccharide transport system ATP-binding protein
VAFSGIEQFIDTPTKRYSSGMKVRLAFAVAAHLEPDILIIDEVLAVGDAEFQRKCLGKMQEISGQDGRTVLFVSHNMAAVKNLCTRGIVLKNGKLVFDGTQIEAVNYYQTNIDTSHIVDYGHELDNTPGNEFVKILACKVNALTGDNITIDSGIKFELLIYNYLENENLDVTFDLRNTDEVNVFHNGVIITKNKDSIKGYYTIKGELQPNTINGGIYFFSIFIGQDTNKLLFKVKDFVQFEVIYEDKGRFIKSTPGVMYPSIPFSVTHKES